MPWIEVNPMDQKVLFIADHLRRTASFSDLCERYHISRKTGYKWVQRYHELGFDGLHEQSRRPQQHPSQTPLTVRKAIIQLRISAQCHSVRGPKKIQALLRNQHPDWHIPSRTTIYTILCQEQLVRKQRQRHPTPPYPQPFDPVTKPNDVWSADYKGQAKTQNGTWCYPLTIMDHVSRFLLACTGFQAIDRAGTRQAFERLFQEYGLPTRIRTDNGFPFASRSAGGLCALSIWWVRLGIVPERIKPGKPQQNGRHERMHKTLKQDVMLPTAITLEEQQHRFDAFRSEYNLERPHEHLGQQPPASLYTASHRSMPERLPEVEYPGHLHVVRVNPNGVIYHRGNRIYVSGLLKGEYLGLEETVDGVWNVFFSFIRLGRFDLSSLKKETDDYITLHV
jgi:putative transposase